MGRIFVVEERNIYVVTASDEEGAINEAVAQKVEAMDESCCGFKVIYEYEESDATAFIKMARMDEMREAIRWLNEMRDIVPESVIVDPTALFDLIKKHFENRLEAHL